MWDSAGLDSVVAKSVADSATMYNGNRYLVPFNYHYSGVFYNKTVFSDAGVDELPTDWEGFVALCEKLNASGVKPIALGSMNRWPAQFWFDYLLLRTAGPDYRARLMAGDASYDDPEVHTAMGMWKDLVDAGHFTEKRQCRFLDRRIRQGRAWRRSHDAHGNLDYRVLEWPGSGAGRGLRLLPLPKHL